MAAATRQKGWGFKIIALFLGVLSGLALLEIALRFAPVNEGLNSLPVNADAPVFHFQPDRDSTWSRNWNFQLRNSVHTNNAGFVSAIDYECESEDPLIAVIGDSYMEAAMVPWDKTGQALMHSTFSGNPRVYTFAASGGSLSQYLIWARFARDEYMPDAVVVVVVSNDFDESLLEYKNAPGFHYFVEKDDGKMELVRVDYEISVMQSLVRRSALGMYLVTNLNATTLPSRMGQPIVDDEQNTGTRSIASERRVTASKRAVDAFLTMLPTAAGLDPSKIVLVVDAMRPQLYDEEQMKRAPESFFGVMRNYLFKQASKRGFEAIDMQPLFIRGFREDGMRFEFPADGHWNENAHKLFADAVIESETISRLLDTVASADESHGE